MENRDGIIKKIKKKIAERKPYTTKTANKYGQTVTTTLKPRSEKHKVEESSGDYSTSKKRVDKKGNIKKDVTKYYDKDGNLKEKLKLKFKELKNANPSGPDMSVKVVTKSPGQKKIVKKSVGYGMPIGVKKAKELFDKMKKK